MRTERIEADFCVVGGGMAGVCAAIAAAHGGLKTVLIQDRPVLGGNASSEIRVWIQGATASGNNRFAREGGILNEILLEHLWRNPECSPHLFDALLLDRVTREPNVILLLDTAVFECQVEGDSRQVGDGPGHPGPARRIASVAAFNSFNQTRYEVSAGLFADCSGDGILGFLAGADFRMGREARHEYGEPWAPEQADSLTLGDSMYFHTKRHPHPVRFVAPGFAIDITAAGIPPARIERLARTAEPFGCELWWCEYGGLLHAIHDAERIKDHLTRLVYGIWDYVKNSGKFADVENLTLEWVGSLPGKREGRRFLGPHVLTQQEIVARWNFPDGIGAAGWSIDLHPAGGIYSPDAPSMHLHAAWVYNIPFRCLHSRNVENLLLAGRLISASHVAFGSIRVMGTGAMTGQAVGTAAAQCVRERIVPRELSADPAAVARLQQRLLRDGQHIVGRRNEDPADLARSAEVVASSTAILDERAEDHLAVGVPRGFTLMVPLADNQTEWIELLLGPADAPAPADKSIPVRYNIWIDDVSETYSPSMIVSNGTVQVSPDRPGWVRIRLPCLEQPQNVWLIFDPSDHVQVHCRRWSTAGMLFENHAFRHGAYQRHRGTPCFRLDRPQMLYDPGNVIDGRSRPDQFPRSWVSGPLADGPQFIELALAQPAAIGQVQVTLNGDVNQLIWTQLFESDRRTMGEIVRDFDVEVLDDAGQVVRRAEVRDNHQQLVRVDLGGAVGRRVRVNCRACWDHDRAEIHEVRVYQA